MSLPRWYEVVLLIVAVLLILTGLRGCAATHREAELLEILQCEKAAKLHEEFWVVPTKNGCMIMNSKEVINGILKQTERKSPPKENRRANGRH